MGVSRSAGLPRSSLGNALKGEARWHADLIEAAAAGLGVHAYELILGPDQAPRFNLQRDGPMLLRQLAGQLEAGSLATAQPSPELQAVMAAIDAQDFPQLLRAAAKLGDTWDD